MTGTASSAPRKIPDLLQRILEFARQQQHRQLTDAGCISIMHGIVRIVQEDLLEAGVPCSDIGTILTQGGKFRDIQDASLKVAIALANDNYSKAAASLGIGRATLYRWLGDRTRAET